MTSMQLSMSPDALRARMEYAGHLSRSSLLGAAYRQQPANVLIAIETGAALGIPAAQALASIAVINGRPTLSADLMAALVRKAGHKLRVREHDGAVTAELIRADDPDFTFTVTWDRAKAQQAGLWGNKGPWSQYPLQMMRARAITEVCRQGASDALAGVIYTPEELGADVDADGNVVTVPDATTTRVERTPESLVEGYCRKYGADPEELRTSMSVEGIPWESKPVQDWLMAHIPTTSSDENQYQTSRTPQTVDAEIVTDDETGDNQ